TALRPTADEHTRVQAQLEAAGFERGRTLVVLNANAGRLSLERRWPATSFAELARRLVLEHGCSVALVGAPSEQRYVGELAARIGVLPAGRVMNLAGELTIGELCALLERATAVVTNDSGPMHLAAALG